MIRTLLRGAAALALVVAASGCSGSSRSTSAQPHSLTDLHSIGQLQRAFNSASAEPRLVVIVSPT